MFHLTILLIEPLRNWNTGGQDYAYFFIRLLIEPLRNWNVERQAFSMSVYLLLIEPLRNWNPIVSVPSTIVADSFNRTFKELKFGYIGCC